MKKNNLLYRIVKPLLEIKGLCARKIRDYQAVRNFRSERKIYHPLINDKINVGFVITQNLSDWGKTEPIFFALKSDGRFEVTIICIPGWYGETRTLDNKLTNDTYEELSKMLEYRDVNIVNGWKGGDDFVDLETFNFSYVFYNSPYPMFSPTMYHPKYVSKFTKLCYTPYGFILSKVFYPISASWDFYRWLYCCYCCSIEEKKYFDSRIKKAKTQKLQRIAFCGFPRIYQFLRKQNTESLVWSFSKNYERVIWTPRWSTNDSICGSNFFKYKDFFQELARRNIDIDFVFRPHPLTFGNFIQTGEMTREEVDFYKKKCNTDNSRLDETSEYASTFWQSTVLITDFSSVIIEYFITGKPIIFCTTKTNMDEPTEEFIKILSCCYIANNENEIKSYLEQLHAGMDSLKEKRQSVIGEIFGNDLEHIPEKIAEDLYLDWKKNNISSPYK